MKSRIFLQFLTAVVLSVVGWQLFLMYTTYKEEKHALNTMDLILRYGYQGEEHKVVTEDGYILTVFRIPDGRNRAVRSSGPKRVVLLQHGTLSCSSAFVAYGPGKSLAFELADHGYDVWIGNGRGNKYGMAHLNYKTSDPQFWDFSGDEIGLKDIPATIDYILNTTSNEQIYYVGHSLGAGLVFGLAAHNPEYNKKLALVVALAPGVFLNSCRSSFINFFIGTYAPFIHHLGPRSFLPYTNEVLEMAYPFCNPDLFLSIFCEMFYLLGGPTTNLNKANLPLITATSVSSTSAKLMTHIGQVLKTGKFHYWNPHPDQEYKVYPLHSVTAPVAIFYTDNDYIIHPKNVLRLSKILPNVQLVYKVPHDSFNHLDFLYGETAADLVNKEILKTLENSHLGLHAKGNITKGNETGF